MDTIHLKQSSPPSITTDKTVQQSVTSLSGGSSDSADITDALYDNVSTVTCDAVVTPCCDSAGNGQI